MCGGSDNTTTQTQTQSLPPWLQQNYQNLQSQAQGIAATPYQAYDQARIAPLTQGQQQATDTAQAMQGNYEGDLNTARTYGNMAAGNVAGNYYTPQTYTTQGIHIPTITPQQAQAQYAQAQYAPAAAQAGTQYAQAQSAQAQQAQAQYAQAQQAGVAQAQAPGNVQAQGVGAMQIGSGHVGTDQFGQQAFQQYGSPYQQDVINSTMAELNRQKTLDQNNATSQATLGGAFGGDRAAVQQAEIGRNYGQIQAQALAGLNNQNWAQAQNMFTNDQGRGLQAQGMNQSAGLQASMANQGTNLQAQQANQSAGLQASLANQGWQGNVGLANMGAANTAQLTNAQLGTQANLQNANLGTNTSQFNAGLGTQNSQFNAGLGTQTSQFNAGQGNQVGMYNAGLTTQNNQFNTGQGNQVGMYNAGLGTQNSQFNAGLNYTGQAQNAANSLQGQQFMAGQNLQAQQLNDQSRQYNASLAAADRNRQLAVSQQFGNITGQEQQAKLNDIGALMQTGGMQQQQNQQNLDTAYNDFLAQRQYPFQTTSWLGGIYNGTPAPISSTGTTVTPGPSPISQIAGAGLSAAALYGMYGGFKDGGMARRGLGAGYADGGPAQQQPLSFWGAGPGGVSPALQIGLAIMGGQSPHALTNIGQGAAQGLQAQQEAGMNAAKMKLWGAQGRKETVDADQIEAQQRGLKAFQDAMGDEGGAAAVSGKKGAVMTPEAAGLPAGGAPSSALPGAGATAPATPQTPAPTPATTMPTPTAPALGTPSTGGTAVPAPAPAPSGGGIVPSAAAAPAAAVPQVPVVGGAPAEAPDVPHPTEVKGALADFPQLAQALKTIRAGAVSGMGGGNPAVMTMVNQARETLTQAAKDGQAISARGQIEPLPGFLQTAAQKAAATAAGEWSVKGPAETALINARGKVEYGLNAQRAGEERNTLGYKATLTPDAEGIVFSNDAGDQKVIPSTQAQKSSFLNTGVVPKSLVPAMKNFGIGDASKTAAVPAPTAAPAAPVDQSLPATDQTPPAPQPAPTAPSAAVPGGYTLGARKPSDSTKAGQVEIAQGNGKLYNNLQHEYTTSPKVISDIDTAAEALKNVQTGPLAERKANVAAYLRALGQKPEDWGLTDSNYLEVFNKAAMNVLNRTYGEMVEGGGRGGIKMLQAEAGAAANQNLQPEAIHKILAKGKTEVLFGNKQYEDMNSHLKAGNPIATYDPTGFMKNTDYNKMYSTVYDSMGFGKGENPQAWGPGGQASPGSGGTPSATGPASAFKKMSDDALLKTLGIGR
jgi:hypothetical protein